MPLTDMRGDPVVAGRWYWARLTLNGAIAVPVDGVGKFSNDLNYFSFACTGGYIASAFTDFVPAQLPKEYEGK
jgi:hypothetical protein